MKNLILVSLAVLLLTTEAFASGIQKFDLSIPSNFKTEQYKSDLENWRKSLVTGLGYDETEINEAIFLKTDIPLKVNGHESIGQVYQNKNLKNQFFVLASKTIIDFNAKLVGTMGVFGISTHPTPSKRMVIVLAPSKHTNLLGVTLDYAVKTQVKPPVFKNNAVTYEWHAW